VRTERARARKVGELPDELSEDLHKDVQAAEVLAELDLECHRHQQVLLDVGHGGDHLGSLLGAARLLHLPLLLDGGVVEVGKRGEPHGVHRFHSRHAARSQLPPRLLAEDSETGVVYEAHLVEHRGERHGQIRLSRSRRRLQPRQRARLGRDELLRGADGQG